MNALIRPYSLFSNRTFGVLIQVFLILSPFFFPWWLVACLLLLVAVWMPLVPLAIGVLEDVLYASPHLPFFLWGTLFGLAVTVGAFIVRSRLKTSIMGA